MVKTRLHIGWLWSSIILMVLTACSSSDDKAGQQPTMLTIYVYSPEHPMLTRSDVGPVNATEAENKVTSLQIWVYDGVGNRVGYLNTKETATLNAGEGAVYQIPVPDDFAKNKPNVDVYVMANVTSETCGITPADFTESTSRTNLQDKAKIVEPHFGLSSLTTVVPDDGLPMAGVLKDQPVIGDAPVLRIGTQSDIATVKLTRAVSKLRFVFANTAGTSAKNLSIKGITLNAGMIPNEEFLFPQAQALEYNSTSASLLSTPIAEVVKKENPEVYVYNAETQTAQDYENLLNGAGLTEVGAYYLRESDRKLEGTISYQIEGEVQPLEATFRMRESDFKRNHSWIVYAYYEGLSGMQVQLVDVTPWEEKNATHTVYNW